MIRCRVPWLPHSLQDDLAILDAGRQRLASSANSSRSAAVSTDTTSAWPAESREGLTLDFKRYRLAVSTPARSLSASKLSSRCARMKRVRLAPAAVAATCHRTAPEGLET